MSEIIMAVEQYVLGKIDAQFLQEQISDNVVFLFAFTKDGKWQNPVQKTSNGKLLFVIKMSYS